MSKRTNRGHLAPVGEGYERDELVLVGTDDGKVSKWIPDGEEPEPGWHRVLVGELEPWQENVVRDAQLISDER